MRKIFVIGIGVGDPDQLTIQAIRRSIRSMSFFFPDKGAEKAALRELRTVICRRFIENEDYRTIDVAIPQRASGGDYLAGVDEWHGRLADIYGRLFAHELAADEIGAVLVWGDPAIYDSMLRVIERVRAGGLALEIEVVPGISSVQVLAANTASRSIRSAKACCLTTGRKLADGLADQFGSVVVLLDGAQAFARLAEADLDIFWGAYLGTDDEILRSGKLADVGTRSRRSAPARANGMAGSWTPICCANPIRPDNEAAPQRDCADALIAITASSGHAGASR